jgi:hypothetical protein
MLEKKGWTQREEVQPALPALRQSRSRVARSAGTEEAFIANAIDPLMRHDFLCDINRPMKITAEN